MILALIIIAGLLGVVGHWLTRYSQGRTNGTFKEYMYSNWTSTAQSLFANLGSSATIYTTAPDDIHGKALILVVISSYMAGYMMDSTFNRDKSPEPTIVSNQDTVAVSGSQRPVSDFVIDRINKEVAHESLNDLLADDSKL